MQFSIKSKNKVFIACVVLFGFYSHPSLAQSNADYLKLLEGEARNASIDKKTKATDKKPSVITLSPSSDGKIPSGLSPSDFMQSLKINYIGTYFLLSVFHLDRRKKFTLFIKAIMIHKRYALKLLK
jgi:hypothetical protein